MKKKYYYFESLLTRIVFYTLMLIFATSTHLYSTGSMLKYVVHSFVKITTSEGKIIYVDPYSITESEPADIILITHEDYDHNDLSKLTQKSSCQVIRSSNALQNGVYQTFKIGNIKISAVPAYDTYHNKSKCVGYIIEADGIKLYHAGDTGKIPEMGDLVNQNITYAMLPMYIGGSEMNQSAELINAKYIIPIHTNWPSLTYNTTAVAQFTSSKKLVVLPGESIELVAERRRASGNILRVPQDYGTIQKAIETSQKGDTVLVTEGKYYENVNFKGKGIVLTSKYYQTKNWQTVFNTIIDGSKAVNKDSASTVSFVNKEDSTSVLDGFTITGGTGTKWVFGTNTPQEGGGIILGYTSATIKNNIITNNFTRTSNGVISGGGGGISSLYGNPTIYNNVIVSNTSGYAGGLVLNWSGGKVRNNIIYHNSATGQYGSGGMMIWKTPNNSAIVENNTIVGNISATTAGGITINLADANSIPVVKNNIVYANKQLSGPQVTNAQYVYYCNIEDDKSAQNISINPNFIDATFILADNSMCIDAGDATIDYNDVADGKNINKACLPSKGGLRNDVGVYGGKLAKALPLFTVTDLYTSYSSKTIVGKVGTDGSVKIDLHNLSSNKLTIDSVAVIKKNIFNIPVSIKGKILDIFGRDTIQISYRPTAGGTLSDTLTIFFKANGFNKFLKVALVGLITDIIDRHTIQYDYRLFNSYPNPFNPATKIKFTLAKKTATAIKILDVLGKEIEKICDEELEAGIHEISWCPKNCIASGVYLINLIAGNFSATNKIILMK